jgi:hypothetical protein
MINLQTPDYAKLPTTYPTWGGAPRHWQFDGASGRFLVGTSRELPELWLQPIDFRWCEGERWSRANQGWLDLAFVDSDHVVSLISLKKASAVNVFDYLLRLQSGKITADAVHPQSVWLKLVPVPKTTLEGEPFYVVEVEEASFAPEEQFNDVRQFAESGLFQWILVGEVER